MNGIHLRLFRAEQVPIGPLWAREGVQSRFWRFYANDDDGATLGFADGDCPLRGGGLYFVPAQVRFSYRCTRPLQHFYIHFDVMGLSPFALRDLWAGPIAVPSPPALKASVRALAAELPSGTALDTWRECRLKAVLYEAMALYLSHVPEEIRRHSELQSADLEAISPAVHYIERHLADPLPIPVLAAHCGLSADTFARRFRQCVGQTPAQYVLEQRVTQAAQRLLFSGDSIERIAEATGFGNRSYFSRLFTNRTGLSPAAYRRSGQVGT